MPERLRRRRRNFSCASAGSQSISKRFATDWRRPTTRSTMRWAATNGWFVRAARNWRDSVVERPERSWPTLTRSRPPCASRPRVRRERGVGLREFIESEARTLGDDIVDGRFAAGWGFGCLSFLWRRAGGDFGGEPG